MPEFRFRRKKQNRRKTVNNPEEAAKQVQAAKQLAQPDKRNSVAFVTDLGKPDGREQEPVTQDLKAIKRVEPVGKFNRSSLVQEREKFFELLKTKYPEQASNLEILTNGEGDDTGMTNGHDNPEVLDPPIGFQDGDDIIKTTSSSEMPSIKAEERSIASTYDDCLFLRYGKSVRHCPMPSPITLSTVKNLYRNLFDINDSVLSDPDCSLYVRGRALREWARLENISMVTDHCTLLLLEPGHAPNHTPSPAADSDINVPLDLTGARHASQDSQPHTGSSGEGGGSHTSVGRDKETTPTIIHGLKHNGLWRTGRSKEVEDLSKLPDNLPLHGQTMSSPLSLASSTSGVYSEPSIDPKRISEQTRHLQNNVKNMKSELQKLRKDHLSKMADFSLTVRQTSNQITAALRAFVRVGGVKGDKGEVFRRERLELYQEKESYEKFSKQTLDELRILETAVEEMRVDVVERRCGVVEVEVEALSQAVATTTKAVTQLHDQFVPMESKIKRVMEGELQTVVREETFIQEEAPKVSTATETCSKLVETLGVLTQFATVQSHRTPLVPYFPLVTNPDRQSLLENIQAVIPNHTHRIECLKRAEVIFQKKKELHSPLKLRLKQFESKLQIQRDHLHHIEIANIENRQEMKLKANFMEERYKLEKEIERELETERALANQKREQRKKQMEELWKWQQKAKVDDERLRQRQSIHMVMQGVKSDSNRSIPGSTSDGSNAHSQDSASRGHHLAPAPHHTRASSDDQTLHPHPSHSHSNSSDATPSSGSLQLVPAPKSKRFRKKDHVKPWQRKSIGYVGEFENLYQSIQDEVVEGAKTRPHEVKPRLPSISKIPTDSKTKSHDQASNQIAASLEKTVVKNGPLSLGPKVNLEVKEVNSNPRQQHFQTTPPFKHPSKQSSNSQSSRNVPKQTAPIKFTSRPPASGGTRGPVSKKPQSNGVPNRYSMHEYFSQPDTDSLGSVPSKSGYKSSINSLSQPSNEEQFRSHMHPMLTNPDQNQKRNTIGVARGRAGDSHAHKPMKRSNSDDSLYESSTLERRKAHGLTNAPYKGRQQQRHNDLSPPQNRKWAMNIFNRDTLPVEVRQQQFDRHGNPQGMRTRNSSASSGSSSGRQGSKVKGPSSQRYPQSYNIPRTRSNVTDIPSHGVRHHESKHARNCPAHPHSHGVPMRPTRSAQTPRDAPLTSYPRVLAAATHTFQMRSASNGVVQQHHRNNAGRVTQYPGHVMSGGSHVTGRHNGGDQAVGSLV